MALDASGTQAAMIRFLPLYRMNQLRRAHARRPDMRSRLATALGTALGLAVVGCIVWAVWRH